MRSELYKADSAGKFRANLAGRGFRVTAGIASPAMPDYSIYARPGRFPLRVRPDGSGQPLHIGNSDARFPKGGFEVLDFEGAESGDVFCVETFDDGEAVMPAGSKMRAVYRVQSATALAAGAPAGSVGFAVRPQTTALTYYASGTLGTARLWVRDVEGNWTDTLEDIDFATTPVVTRFVDTPGDRVYLATAAAMNMAVDATAEVG